jgi:hypothetical protein
VGTELVVPVVYSSITSSAGDGGMGVRQASMFVVVVVLLSVHQASNS